MSDDEGATALAGAGLCATCAHVQVVVSARKSVFVMCRLSVSDPRYPKYPRLPVVRCAGYDTAPEAG